jgi:putative transposase
MKTIAHERRRFGYRLLKREGYTVNPKKLFRLYCEEKLEVRRRGGRKRAIDTRAPMMIPLASNERRSLDFVSYQLTDGRRLRILAIVDDCTRGCLALVAETSVSGVRVSHGLDSDGRHLPISPSPSIHAGTWRCPTPRRSARAPVAQLAR